MARKPRIHYAGAIYHVIARGNNREIIFRDSDDKQKYLGLLQQYMQKYMFDVFAYVLMDNHLHMILRVGQNPLAKIMHGMQLRYTQYFNQRYEHVGHVFQQRYKAFLCTDDAYLLQLLRYIHQNPVRAGMREKLDYSWSSHQAYSTGMNSLVKVDYILGILNEDRQTAVKNYFTFIEKMQEAPDIVASVLNDTESMRENELTDTYGCNSWEGLLDKVARETGIDKNKIIGKCRVRNVVAARNRFIYDVIKCDIMSQADLARKLQIDPARISKGYQQAEQLMLNKSISQA